MVARFGTHLIGDPEIKMHNRSIMTINNIDVFNFDVEKEPKCLFCTDLGVNTEKEPVLTRPPKEDPNQKYEFTLGDLKTYEKELKRVVDNAIDDFMKKVKSKEITPVIDSTETPTPQTEQMKESN